MYIYIYTHICTYVYNKPRQVEGVGGALAAQRRHEEAGGLSS